MVGHLHARINSDELVRALGWPYSKENGIGDSPVVYESWLYQADGTNLPLIIQLDEGS
jgi:hypothetical protein